MFVTYKEFYFHKKFETDVKCGYDFQQYLK